MSDSPFLPGTNVQYAWDSTSLGYLKTCARLYYLVMIEGWTAQDESVHLRFGIEYHHSLQGYDLLITAGIKHDDVVFDVVRDLMIRTAGWESEHATKNRWNLLRSVIWHLERYKDDGMKPIIRENGKPAVELSFRFELDWGPVEGGYRTPKDGERFAYTPYILCGHLDRAVEVAGETYVEDYKTSTYAPTSWYFKKFEPDNQMSLYSIAGKVILGTPVKGVIIDAAQVREDETNFGRGITMRTEEQQQEWLDDLHYWLALQEQYALHDRWPMNDTACDKFGGCRFREVCSKSPSVRERFLESTFIKQPPEERWNPLKAR